MSAAKKETETPKTPEEFAQAYQALCKEYGYQVVVTPAWIARDDGSWSTTLQHSVGKLPEGGKS